MSPPDTAKNQKAVFDFFNVVPLLGIGHTHGFSFAIAHKTSFVRPGLAGPEGPRLRLSIPNGCYKWQQPERYTFWLAICAPAWNRTKNNGLEVRSYIHLTTRAVVGV